MTGTTTSASPRAVRLLQELLESTPGGRVFTSDEAVAAGEAIGLSPGHVYKLLSELTARGLLDRPRGHLYVMQPPFGGITPVRPLAIAVRAVDPAAVSGETALAHWDLQEQAPLHEEVISTPARIQWTRDVGRERTDRLWTVAGGAIRFRHVPLQEMFGITTVRLDSDTVVPMFDRERAILELFTGEATTAGDLAAELIEMHRPDIDFARIRKYAERLGVTVPGPESPSSASLA